MAFFVHPDPTGWRVTNGSLAFGPYSTQAKAQDAAQSLSHTYSRFDSPGPSSRDGARSDATPRFRRRAD